MLVCAETGHSELQQLAGQPQPSGAAVPTGVQLSCGVSGSISVREGAKAVVRSILCRYKPRVPSDSWIRVCACMARMVHALQCGDPHATGAAEGGSSSGNAPSRSLPEVLVAVADAVRSAIHEELHACDYGWRGQKGEPRRKEAGLRLQQLCHHRGVAKVIIFDECALLARQIELGLTAAVAPTFEQVRACCKSSSLWLRFQQHGIWVLAGCVCSCAYASEGKPARIQCCARS